MHRLILTALVLIVGLGIACAPKSTDLMKATTKSNNVYEEIAPQVQYALDMAGSDTKKKEQLLKIQHKLDNFVVARDQCMADMKVWDETGTPPPDTRANFETMKKEITDAVVMSHAVYIYHSECSATTAIKGKAGNSCQ